MSERDKCPTCEDKGYYKDPASWNTTLGELVKCPDCKLKGKRPKSLVGLLT